MAHKFNPQNIQKLDNPERKKILPPKEILIESGLKSNDIMVDIGAAIGYFSLPAAEIVGNNGMVIAVDTCPELLEELESRLLNANLTNIRTVQSQEYDFMVNEATSDFVLMAFVLHEIEDKILFLENAKKIMKQKSKLVIIEWDKKITDQGPPVTDRLDKSEVTNLLKQLNFNNIRHIEYNDYFYFITADKQI